MRKITMRTRAYAIVISMAFLVILAGCASQPKTATGAATVPATQWNGQVKEFNVRAFQFGYDPSVLEVNLGDKVRITAYSSDVPHGLAIPQFGVNMKLLDKNPVTTEFIADKPGTFTFFCSIPCGSGHGAMQGKLIVKE